MLPGIVTSSSAVVTRGVTRARLLIAAGHREAARELLEYAANGAGEGADVARELLRQIEVVESC
jgi:Tfp pilus assembly protein FimV